MSFSERVCIGSLGLNVGSRYKRHLFKRDVEGKSWNGGDVSIGLLGFDVLLKHENFEVAQGD